jgi:hypothetical protein
MLVIELTGGSSIAVPGARHVRREGESLVVTNADGDVLRAFVRDDVKGLRIGPDTDKRALKRRGRGHNPPNAA